MKHRFYVVALSCILGGCTALRPLPVIEPAGGTPTNRTQPDYTRGGLIPAGSIDEAVANLRIYRDSYFSTADKLRSAEFDNSDLNLLGGILALAGGVAKSVETAVTGGVISAGGSIISQRYQLKNQALNYEKAGDTMNCMYRNAIFLKPLAPAATPDAASFINERIDEVRGKLRKAQIAVDLLAPNLSELEGALKKLDTATNKANIAADTASKVQIGFLKSAFTQSDVDAANAALLRAAAEKVYAEIQKCAATV